jgi:hypothetical protein
MVKKTNLRLFFGIINSQANLNKLKLKENPIIKLLRGIQ